MPSVVDQLVFDANAILKDIETMLTQHSELKRFQYDSGPLILLGGDYFWTLLRPEGTKLQSKIRMSYTDWLLKARLLLAQHPHHLDDLDRAADSVMRVIDQQGSVYHATVDKVYQDVDEQIRLQVEILRNTYDASAGSVILAPDTNALLTNPGLEDWTFESINSFEVVLLPTVLGELDELKITHRVPEVRDKANGLIRRLKGYRNRGRLIDGVPLRKGVSTLRTTAREPDFSRTLNWLNPQNKDDRILASFLEVMVKHPHSAVMLVTTDINMQNKAESIGIHYIEPPQPVSEA